MQRHCGSISRVVRAAAKAAAAVLWPKQQKDVRSVQRGAEEGKCVRKGKGVAL